ncbi:PhzF family phenazine biosynthesis protein [Qipengyuania qiaonensis]|uniref:PhzF family phenazine biosynthesis protein n=1 Tax=Qipengyuania qiaonensis TaxID=2867240 RepID=A0ABS7J2X3_9SPHN|nr:PhzF family phenazine biosynthesis protein [Qipengyuania qiaonensis]MBX7481670.1 PhzF family phenazine biosynthesis protein [Qipengyuania qiaonensis]
MPSYPFQIVDVFGRRPFSGNPVAVLALEKEIPVEDMLAITRWLNFSETTFLLPPDDPAADYRVRIFCPARELPFAGHPTLGSCHAWLEAGGSPRDPGLIVQQCGAGLVTIRNSGGALAFAAPPVIRGGEVEERDLVEIASILRIDRSAITDARSVDNGPGWVAVRLRDASAVLALEPVRWHEREVSLGAVGMYPPGGSEGVSYEIRAFFSDPFGGIVEDPVCGSLNASVAQWLIGKGACTPPYRAAQGRKVGRDGLISIDEDRHGRVWVEGRTHTLFEGRTRIPG